MIVHYELMRDTSALVRLYGKPKKTSQTSKRSPSSTKSNDHNRAVELKSPYIRSAHGELKEKRPLKREKEPTTLISSKSKHSQYPIHG